MITTAANTTIPITIKAQDGIPPFATSGDSEVDAFDVSEIVGVVVVVEGRGAGVGLSRRSRNVIDG